MTFPVVGVHLPKIKWLDFEKKLGWTSLPWRLPGAIAAPAGQEGREDVSHCCSPVMTSSSWDSDQDESEWDLGQFEQMPRRTRSDLGCNSYFRDVWSKPSWSGDSQENVNEQKQNITFHFISKLQSFCDLAPLRPAAYGTALLDALLHRYKHSLCCLLSFFLPFLI